MHNSTGEHSVTEGTSIRGDDSHKIDDPQPVRKSLKEFKAAITPGRTIRVIEHWSPRYRNTVRTVGEVQTNGYWFT